MLTGGQGKSRSSKTGQK
ncbi:hypothetical protein ABVN80_07010 [Acinetobacter baumannii]